MAGSCVGLSSEFKGFRLFGGRGDEPIFEFHEVENITAAGYEEQLHDEIVN
jgi:hypothetical protein